MGGQTKRLRVMLYARARKQDGALLCVGQNRTVKDVLKELRKLTGLEALESLWTRDGWRLWNRAEIWPLVDHDSVLVACDKETFPAAIVAAPRPVAVAAAARHKRAMTSAATHNALMVAAATMPTSAITAVDLDGVLQAVDLDGVLQAGDIDGVLQAGDTVEFHGLQKAHLNGCRGRVDGSKSSSCRFLELVLPINLRRVAAGPIARASTTSTCFICLEPHSGPGSSQWLLHGGCACRGGSGFGHVTCVAKAAQETNGRMWQYCPTCKQRWTEQMELGLARAKLASRASLPEEARGRLSATNLLTQALKSMGEYAAALSLGVATLAIARRALGNEHKVTLVAIAVLAAVHNMMGNTALALPLQTEQLAVRRRVYGDDDPNTMTAAGNLAGMHVNMENYDAALPLMTENLERRRRLLGDDSASTLTSMSNLAMLHADMGRHDLALPLHRDTLQRRRRVLGNRHPSTLRAMAKLGQSLCESSDTAAGIRLLEEAVAGSTAVLGADHPRTNLRQELQDCWRRLSTRKL
jgi:hypothetical protein